MLSITKRVFLHYPVSDPKRVLFAATWICAGGKKVKNSADVETSNSSVRTLTCISSLSIDCTLTNTNRKKHTVLKDGV